MIFALQEHLCILYLRRVQLLKQVNLCVLCSFLSSTSQIDFIRFVPFVLISCILEQFYYVFWSTQHVLIYICNYTCSPSLCIACFSPSSLSTGPVSPQIFAFLSMSYNEIAIQELVRRQQGRLVLQQNSTIRKTEFSSPCEDKREFTARGEEDHAVEDPG